MMTSRSGMTLDIDILAARMLLVIAYYLHIAPYSCDTDGLEQICR